MAAIPGGLWRDEALFAFVVRLESWGSMLHWVAREESHPPLYYVLARAWTMIVGSGEWGLVSLSLLFGIAIIPLAYLVGRSLASVRAGVIAAYVFALSPALIEYSATVRPYSVLPLLCLLSIYALCSAVQRRDTRFWVLFVASGLALLLTHNWAILVVAAEGLVAAVVIVRSVVPSGVARGAFASFTAIAVLYAPWVPVLLGQAEHAGHAGADMSSPIWFARGLIEAPGEFVFFWLWVSVLGLWSVLLSRGEHGREGRSDRTTWIILLTVPVIAYVEAIALSPRSEMLFFRCLVIVFPCVLLALSLWFTHVFTNRALRVALAVMLVQLGLSIRSRAVTPAARSNARDIAAALDHRVEAADLVIIAPLFFASSVNFYLQAPNEQIDFPLSGRQTLVSFRDVWTRVNEVAPLVAAVQRVREARAEHRRVWVVRPAGARPLSADSAAAAQGHWGAAAYVDASHLRDSIKALYGEPVLVEKGGTAPVRYERVVAELYSP